ncbi:hypothetical protein AVEN_270214-1 [Araneus ventricosus]|uniref:Uncharacterized protein n=1 Tax=Araneus ventricosus TaxID=182803 RepID=A0A4Y2G2V2_ARAVE|nr:hypothetical protein AVEN_270214-1 [Araneus ventricosus]
MWSATGFQVRNQIPLNNCHVWGLLHVKSSIVAKRPPAGVVPTTHVHRLTHRVLSPQGWTEKSQTQRKIQFRNNTPSNLESIKNHIKYQQRKAMQQNPNEKTK